MVNGRAERARRRAEGGLNVLAAAAHLVVAVGSAGCRGAQGAGQGATQGVARSRAVEFGMARMQAWKLSTQSKSTRSAHASAMGRLLMFMCDEYATLVRPTVLDWYESISFGKKAAELMDAAGSGGGTYAFRLKLCIQKWTSCLEAAHAESDDMLAVTPAAMAAQCPLLLTDDAIRTAVSVWLGTLQKKSGGDYAGLGKFRSALSDMYKGLR